MNEENNDLSERKSFVNYSSLLFWSAVSLVIFVVLGLISGKETETHPIFYLILSGVCLWLSRWYKSKEQ